MTEVNNREHRATRRKPAAVLAEEAPRLHRIPETAHGRVRTGPHRPGEHPDGRLRERPVLGPGASARREGVRPH